MRIIRARRIDAEPRTSRDIPYSYWLILISIHDDVLTIQTRK